MTDTLRFPRLTIACNDGKIFLYARSPVAPKKTRASESEIRYGQNPRFSISWTVRGAVFYSLEEAQAICDAAVGKELTRSPSCEIAVEREHDFFGATVQLAARLCPHAQPEQILVSNVGAELCLGKALPFNDLGDVFLKGFNCPIRVHAVEWSAATKRCPQ